MIRRIAKRLLPPNSFRRKAAKVVARKLGIVPPMFIDGRYQQWIASAEPLYWQPVKKLKYRPLISVIVPVFNVPEGYLLEAVYSVVNQTYDNWELLLLNASSDAKCQEFTRRCSEIDTRIQVIDIQNQGIGENTNQGLEASRGEYVALLDHDDTLAPEALYEVVTVLQRAKKPAFIYSDEDKLTADSEYRYDPHLKPDWSEHLLRQANYLNHLTVFDRKLVQGLGGYRKGFDGAQDYDLYLRIIDTKPLVHHIPKILYHWRAALTSTASDFSVKKNVLDAGTAALQEHLQRNGLHGTVSAPEDRPGYYSVQYEFDESQPLALILMPGESADQYAEYVRYVVDHLAENADVTEVFTCNLKANQKYLAAHTERLRNVKATDRTDYLRKVCAATSARTFIVLDANVSWDDTQWVRELAGYVQQCKDVGIVAPLLLNKLAANIVDAGLVRSGDALIPLFQGFPAEAHTLFGSTLWTRPLDVVSGRVMAMSRDSMEKYFTEAGLPMEQICGQMQAAGKQVLLCAQATLHYDGDFRAQRRAAPHFSPLLVPIYTVFDFPSVSFVPPTGGDNA